MNISFFVIVLKKWPWTFLNDPGSSWRYTFRSFAILEKLYEVKTPTVSIEYNKLFIQVTLNLSKWFWVKVKTHPDHHSLCEKDISNYYVTPKERYGPDIFLIKWPWTYPHDLGSRTWHTLVSYKYCNWWKNILFRTFIWFIT